MGGKGARTPPLAIAPRPSTSGGMTVQVVTPPPDGGAPLAARPRGWWPEEKKNFNDNLLFRIHLIIETSFREATFFVLS